MSLMSLIGLMSLMGLMGLISFIFQPLLLLCKDVLIHKTH